MSAKVEVAGQSLREWALIILIMSLVMVVVIYGFAVYEAFSNSPNVNITGEIDVAVFEHIIVTIAAAAIIMVSQQLTPGVRRALEGRPPAPEPAPQPAAQHVPQEDHYAGLAPTDLEDHEHG